MAKSAAHKSFFARVKIDVDLQDECHAASTPEEVAIIAQRHGYEVTAKELREDKDGRSFPSWKDWLSLFRD